jgi:hypothetical protein
MPARIRGFPEEVQVVYEGVNEATGEVRRWFDADHQEDEPS